MPTTIFPGVSDGSLDVGRTDTVLELYCQHLSLHSLTALFHLVRDMTSSLTSSALDLTQFSLPIPGKCSICCEFASRLLGSLGYSMKIRKTGQIVEKPTCREQIVGSPSKEVFLKRCRLTELLEPDSNQHKDFSICCFALLGGRVSYGEWTWKNQLVDIQPKVSRMPWNHTIMHLILGTRRSTLWLKWDPFFLCSSAVAAKWGKIGKRQRHFMGKSFHGKSGFREYF